jgi:hypothetical protein
MRKYLLWMSVVISVLFLPVVTDAACLIRLESGGRIWTPHCWEEGGELKFCVGEGVAGVEKNMVRHIEKTAMTSGVVYEAPSPARAPADTAEKAEKSPSSPANVESGAALPKPPAKQVDVKAYQDRMAKLKTDLNRTLARIKKATANNDPGDKEEATAENRRISDEMYRLTDELKEGNNGVLPADWWEGIGKEEPAEP